MKALALFAAALAVHGMAHGAGVGIRAGTTGIGADLAVNVAPALDARVGYSGLKWSYDTKTSNASYNGDFKLSNLNALLDFHPFGPLFRLSGGVIFNQNKYDAVGRPSSGPGAFSATVKSGRSAAPYLGVGWGNVAGTGVNFYADAGVMLMGTPKASINADCTGLTGAQCTSLRGQVASEEQRLQDELKRLKAYPVLNLGFSIGF